MFTGIIEGLGLVSAVRSAGRASRLTVETDFVLDGVRLGDSIAVNGACLTAVKIQDRVFDADVSPETMAKTTFKHLRSGSQVNLERAMRLSDRINGHLVSGHIDGTGVLQSRQQKDNALILGFKVTSELSRYMIPKGSVAVDGISLTINACEDGFFEISLIPHSAAVTTLAGKPAGAVVNIETDMIGKYVERFVMQPALTSTAKKPLDLGFLAENGFL